MEDTGLLPKPTKDSPVHRPTVAEKCGMHTITPEYLHVTDPSRKSDMEKYQLYRKRPHSVITAEPLRIPQFPLQNPLTLSTDPAFTNVVSKYGNSVLYKVRVSRKTPKVKATDPSKWMQNKQKRLRMEGKAYVSKCTKDGEIVIKQPRAIGPRCASNACGKASNRLCDEIGEDARREVFDGFWQSMNWPQRKLYVAEQVDCDPVRRSQAVGTPARRSVSLLYHLMVGGKRKQVCKNMFRSTLGIGDWSVLNWAQKGATKKSESKNKSKKKLEKRQTVCPCLQQNPAPSAVINQNK